MAPPQWIHLTGQLYPYAPDLTAFDVGRWLWTCARETWPDAIAALLMPDHPHVIVRSPDPEVDQRRMGRMLGQLGGASASSVQRAAARRSPSSAPESCSHGRSATSR